MPLTGLSRALKTRVMLRSRQRKIKHFYSLVKPGMKVLDVGVTGLDTGKGPQNYLLKTWPFAPETYTGLGVHDLDPVRARHPKMRFVEYDGRRMPFVDHEFDWAWSNAVIEHVGDRDAQLTFLNEMLRVARNVFFTTPSKYFPIETHTFVPFLHWNDRLFDRWLWKHRPKWRSRTNLWLLSARDVRDLLKASTAKRHTLHYNRVLGWPMTMTIVASNLAPARQTRRAKPPRRVTSAPARATE